MGTNLEVATSYGSVFFIGITVGRAISGFITMKLNDEANDLFRSRYNFNWYYTYMFLPFGSQSHSNRLNFTIIVLVVLQNIFHALFILHQ